MTNKINISDIPVGSLNARCVALISKYAHEAHKHDGRIINVQEMNVLDTISEHANKANSASLSSIYSLLKLELRVFLEESLFTHVDTPRIDKGAEADEQLSASH